MAKLLINNEYSSLCIYVGTKVRTKQMYNLYDEYMLMYKSMN
jgi:hypothetical protein